VSFASGLNPCKSLSLPCLFVSFSCITFSISLLLAQCLRPNKRQPSYSCLSSPSTSLQGQRSVASTVTLASEALADRYLDLRALLKLLTRLTQAEWASQAVPSNTSTGGGRRGPDAFEGAVVDVAQVCAQPVCV
jgi:hypothetical protein